MPILKAGMRLQHVGPSPAKLHGHPTVGSALSCRLAALLTSLVDAAVLLQYLQDLECPLPLAADNRQAVLQWLLSFAVSLEYADSGEDGCSTALLVCQPHTTE